MLAFLSRYGDDVSFSTSRKDVLAISSHATGEFHSQHGVVLLNHSSKMHSFRHADIQTDGRTVALLNAPALVR